MKLTKYQKGFLVVVAFIAGLAAWDAYQINTFHTLNSDSAWSLYNSFQVPAFIGFALLGMGVLAALTYFYTRDKGAAYGTAVAGGLMFLFGLEDLIFFAFSPTTMSSCMDWFTEPHFVYYVASVLGLPCVTPNALWISALIGVGAAYYFYNYLRRRY